MRLTRANASMIRARSTPRCAGSSGPRALAYVADQLSWEAVSLQTHRWIDADVFDDMVHDLPALLGWLPGRADDPTANIVASRTLWSTPERGAGAGDDGATHRHG